MKTAFITGITGFVGPHVARKLLEDEYEVFGLFRRRADGAKPARLVQTGILDEVKLIEGDVTDLTSLIFALDKSRPDVIFHLASQSFVPRSFEDPLETFRINGLGTQNLLEAARVRDSDARVIFAGSSEEYGLQISSKRHLDWALKKYGTLSPRVERVPELPINEDNSLRPMSPYAVSKVMGEHLFLNYYRAYGLQTVVSRGFNHEGVGRGKEFVTSTIVRQCIQLKHREVNRIIIGDVNVFRDWSHIEDIVKGYVLLSSKARAGETYVQGSSRTNSVLTYILLTLEELGYEIRQLAALDGSKKVGDPTSPSREDFFGRKFKKTLIDQMLLRGEVEYTPKDRGLRVKTKTGDVIIEFDKSRYRKADVPILMSDITKIMGLGFAPSKGLSDIIRDQVNFYLNPDNRAS